MRRKVHFYVLGWVCKITAALMSLPFIVAIIYNEEKATTAFAAAIAIALVAGVLLTLKKPNMDSLVTQDGYAIAAEAWVTVSFLGALPLYFSGEIKSFIDCLFESVSGFTTTGASILVNVEACSHAVLFWRIFSHWVGGMGVLVFMLAIISLAGGKSIYIMRAESPGPIVDKMVPQMRKSSAILYSIYIGMTVVLIGLLLLGGMPLFDSLCTAFGTAGTGGFGIKADSIASYSPYLQWVIAIFMMLFGVNFNVYFLLILRKVKDAFKNEEIWTYIGIMVTATAIIAFNLRGSFGGTEELLRTSFFQASSVMTTTGFATADFNLWPELSKGVLVLLMFFGACAGSTAGGFKIARVVLVAKIAKREVKHLANPRTVNVIKFNGKTVDEDTVRSTANYLIMYIALFALSVLLVSFGNYELETSFTAVATCFNNVGPALGAAGPAGNFQFFTNFEKIILMLDMLIGRLEIVPMIILFAPLVAHKSSRSGFFYKLREKRKAAKIKKKTA